MSESGFSYIPVLRLKLILGTRIISCCRLTAPP
jgi:hypothetical protein